MSTMDKLRYLFTISTPAELGLELYTSGKRLLSFADTGEGLDAVIVRRIEAKYHMHQQIDPLIKNYDDEAMDDIILGQAQTFRNRVFTGSNVDTYL